MGLCPSRSEGRASGSECDPIEKAHPEPSISTNTASSEAVLPSREVVEPGLDGAKGSQLDETMGVGTSRNTPEVIPCLAEVITELSETMPAGIAQTSDGMEQDESLPSSGVEQSPVDREPHTQSRSEEKQQVAPQAEPCAESAERPVERHRDRDRHQHSGRGTDSRTAQVGSQSRRRDEAAEYDRGHHRDRDRDREREHDRDRDRDRAYGASSRSDYHDRDRNRDRTYNRGSAYEREDTRVYDQRQRQGGSYRDERRRYDREAGYSRGGGSHRSRSRRQRREQVDESDL